MAIYENINGEIREVNHLYENVGGGVIQEINAKYQNVNGTIYQTYKRRIEIITNGVIVNPNYISSIEWVNYHYTDMGTYSTYDKDGLHYMGTYNSYINTGVSGSNKRLTRALVISFTKNISHYNIGVRGILQKTGGRGLYYCVRVLERKNGNLSANNSVNYVVPSDNEANLPFTSYDFVLNNNGNTTVFETGTGSASIASTGSGLYTTITVGLTDLYLEHK